MPQTTLQIPLSWRQSLSLAAAVLWRTALVAAPPTAAIELLSRTVGGPLEAAAPLCKLAVALLALAVALRWRLSPPAATR